MVLVHVTKPSGFVNCHYAGEKQTSCILMTEGSCPSWSKAPTEVRHFSSCRDWEGREREFSF